MDIHKPKPWHGLREFLKEYLIIVVGVLTALAAEQVVEWVHWRHQVEATQQRVSIEIQTNLNNAYTRLITQRCNDERLRNLRNGLLAHGLWTGAAIRPTPVPAPENIPPFMRSGIFIYTEPAQVVYIQIY